MLLSTVFIGACAPTSQHEALMDNIENAVPLPAEAAPLNHYARIYAKGAGKHVVALYFIPSAPDKARCGAVLAHQAKSASVAQLCPPPQGMLAGERRWFEHPVQPVQRSEGGCTQIDVTYDMDRHRIVKNHCYGSAR